MVTYREGPPRPEPADGERFECLDRECGAVWMWDAERRAEGRCPTCGCPQEWESLVGDSISRPMQIRRGHSNRSDV